MEEMVCGLLRRGPRDGRLDLPAPSGHMARVSSLFSITCEVSLRPPSTKNPPSGSGDRFSLHTLLAPNAGRLVFVTETRGRETGHVGTGRAGEAEVAAGTRAGNAAHF